MDSEDKYFVVMNHEEQYSIWLSYKSIPAGWKKIGEEMSKKDCLNYIENNWKDIRPASLRKIMLSNDLT